MGLHLFLRHRLGHVSSGHDIQAGLGNVFFHGRANALFLVQGVHAHLPERQQHVCHESPEEDDNSPDNAADQNLGHR
jgi:hypothetical protein